MHEPAATVPAVDPAVVAAATRELARRLLAPPAERRPPLELLEGSLRCYEVEYRGFLNRQRRRPPIDLGVALRLAFQALSRPDLAGPPLLRAQALEARFHAAERLFAQRLDARERRAAALRPLRN